ncbi:MAG: 6,7-dimethyl-8-ribityllumazine synthase [Methanopyri archaeon]|nr:6,7-dimethyl-8-ribityllumazine synthase [Methanopyri archaeon]
MADDTIRLALVVTEFNRDITYPMEKLAETHARDMGAEVVEKVLVPGSFEVPLAVKELLERDDVDAVVTLGAIIKGATDHDQVIAQQVFRKLEDLMLEYGKPVALGISGPGMTRAEAQERVKYAKRAVEAAVKMVRRMRELRSG